MPNIPNIKIGNTTYDVKDTVAREHLIEVSAIPPSSTENRLWIKNAENEYQVPTYDEFSDLKNAVNDVTSMDKDGTYLDMEGLTLTEGQYIKSDGTTGTNALMMYSDYIPVPDGMKAVTVNRIVYSVDGATTYAQSKMVWWYNAEKTLIGTGTNTTSGNLLTSTQSEFYNAKYIRVNFARYHVSNFVYFSYYYGMKYTRHLTTSDNFDDITSPGVYAVTVAAIGRPINSSGFLTVNVAPFGTTITQTYVSRRGTLTRVKTSGGWGSWKSLNFGGSMKTLQNTSITDLDDLEYNAIYLLSSGSSNFSHLPYDGFLGTIITMSYQDYLVAGCNQMAISSTNRLLIRHTWGDPIVWSEWKEICGFSIDDTLGVVGKYSGAFTDYNQNIDTGIALKANKSYCVRFYKPRAYSMNVFRGGDTSSYKRLDVWQDEVTFTNGSTAGTLHLYNNNTSGDFDDIEVTVFELDSVEMKAEDVPRVYRVTKSGTAGDYTSLTQCLLDLKDDHLPKTIEIWEGDYDIYQEYIDANVPVWPENDPAYNDTSTQYFDFCVWVPKNTHIIGKGLVRLKWMPDPSIANISLNESKCVSPLNVAASCTIENVEVHCKNGRYCLHNDVLGKREYIGSVQKYINVKFYKYINDNDPVSGSQFGYRPTIGFGIDRAMHHVYENCLFVNESSEDRSRAFYGHSRSSSISDESQSPDITVTNCVMRTEGPVCVKFGNPSSNRNIHIRTLFNNCFISGPVQSILESGTGSCANGFDVQYLNCGNVSMQIDDPNNPYTPKAYNTTLTMVS